MKSCPRLVKVAPNLARIKAYSRSMLLELSEQQPSRHRPFAHIPVRFDYTIQALSEKWDAMSRTTRDAFRLPAEKPTRKFGKTRSDCGAAWIAIRDERDHALKRSFTTNSRRVCAKPRGFCGGRASATCSDALALPLFRFPTNGGTELDVVGKSILNFPNFLSEVELENPILRGYLNYFFNFEQVEEEKKYFFGYFRAIYLCFSSYT